MGNHDGATEDFNQRSVNAFRRVQLVVVDVGPAQCTVFPSTVTVTDAPWLWGDAKDTVRSAGHA